MTVEAPDKLGVGVFVEGNGLRPVMADVNLLIVASVVTVVVVVEAAVVVLSWLTEEGGENEAPVSPLLIDFCWPSLAS